MGGSVRFRCWGVMQEIEMHMAGWAGQRAHDLELQQRVYVRVDPVDFMPYFPEEIASR